MSKHTRAAGDRSELVLRAFATVLAILFLIGVAACADEPGATQIAEAQPVEVPESVPAPAAVEAPAEVEPAPPVVSEPLPPVTYVDAEAVYRAGRYAEAMDLFTSYTDDRPGNAWGQYMLALSAWKAGHLETSEGAFLRSLELDPRHVKSLINLSRVLLDAGRPEEARVHAALAEDLDPAAPGALRVLARVETELGRTDEAIDLYRRALSVDPEDTWSMNNLGLVLLRQERFEEALGPLARATELDSDVAVFQNNLGVALERTEYLQSAAETFERVLELDPDYEKATVSLARIRERGDVDGVADLGRLATAFQDEIARWVPPAHTAPEHGADRPPQSEPAPLEADSIAGEEGRESR